MGLKTQLKKLLQGSQAKQAAGPADTLSTLVAQFPDVPVAYLETFLQVKPFTMTSPERVIGLCQAVEHAVGRGLPGAFVECGVWRGGSSMAIAGTLCSNLSLDREIWLYDTFEGMSPPSVKDVDCFGNPAANLLEKHAHDREGNDSVWCEASLADVQQNLATIKYPSAMIHFVQGKVEETLPAKCPDQIALLRLDTDWFESTWHELIHLYPRLVSGGILIIDDYGHWQGCREAVDRFRSEFAPDLYLHRLDYTGRLAIKP